MALGFLARLRISQVSQLPSIRFFSQAKTRKRLLDSAEEPAKYAKPVKPHPYRKKLNTVLDPEVQLAQYQVPDSISFKVERTSSKFLPVYTDYKNGGTRVLTLLRKIKGDVKNLQEEVSKLTGLPVTVRPGRIEVPGNQRQLLCQWLTRMGF
eukprot:TRINITY_DN317_c0_g1_i3.p1 TRINITY_DN317_c0_g1~~TRINITY_DN317_c0_g1_i3.p1  ORF type:complete len:152 (-),score=13.25 TRINITY_DN317_c0_g1_i3:64-519(-)